MSEELEELKRRVIALEKEVDDMGRVLDHTVYGLLTLELMSSGSTPKEAEDEIAKLMIKGKEESH